MVVREKNCYYAIALTDFFVFLSCAEKKYISIDRYIYLYTYLLFFVLVFLLFYQWLVALFRHLLGFRSVRVSEQGGLRYRQSLLGCRVCPWRHLGYCGRSHCLG